MQLKLPTTCPTRTERQSCRAAQTHRSSFDRPQRETAFTGNRILCSICSPFRSEARNIWSALPTYSKKDGKGSARTREPQNLRAVELHWAPLSARSQAAAKARLSAQGPA